MSLEAVYRYRLAVASVICWGLGHSSSISYSQTPPTVAGVVSFARPTQIGESIPVPRNPVADNELRRAGTSEASVPTLPNEKPIGQVSLDITVPSGAVPPNIAGIHYRAAEDVTTESIRQWPEEVYFWQSPAFRHRPLYFEDTHLERFGMVRYPAFRPIVSGAHFFGSLVALPYHATIVPPCHHVSTPNHYGYTVSSVASQATPGRHLSAAAVQTATIAGLILLIP